MYPQHEEYVAEFCANRLGLSEGALKFGRLRKKGLEININVYMYTRNIEMILFNMYPISLSKCFIKKKRRKVMQCSNSNSGLSLKYVLCCKSHTCFY